MTRVVKSPEVRREELIEAAEALFLTRGYEQTSVRDIVARAGVAKGLFYYYFDSKDAVLDAIAARYIGALAGIVEAVAGRDDLDAIGKIRRIFTAILGGFGVADGGIERLATIFDRRRHGALHSRLATGFAGQVAPSLAAIFRQGVREGLFSTEHPEFVAQTLLTWAVSLHHTVDLPLDPAISPGPTARAVEDAVERLLGAPAGSLGITETIEAAVSALSNVSTPSS